MSATHSLSGASVAKLVAPHKVRSSCLLKRKAVSEAHPPPPKTEPLRDAARRISLATRFLPQRMAIALSSAWTLGAP